MSQERRARMTGRENCKYFFKASERAEISSSLTFSRGRGWWDGEVRRVKGSRGGLGGRGSWSGSKQGWRVVQEEGRKDGVTGSRETGGRRNAACLSLPFSLSLSLSPSNIHTRTQTHALGGRHQNPESLR